MSLYTLQENVNDYKMCHGVEVLVPHLWKEYRIRGWVVIVRQATLCVGCPQNVNLTSEEFHILQEVRRRLGPDLNSHQIHALTPLEDSQNLPLYHALGVLDSSYSLTLGQWLICSKAEACALRCGQSRWVSSAGAPSVPISLTLVSSSHYFFQHLEWHCIHCL